MKKLLLLFSLTFALHTVFFAQGNNCITADPFCTGTTYSFPNNTNTTAESGPNYGCLLTQPNPAWYYLQIGNSGNIDIGISQVDNNGSGIDVDFIAYGPFADPTSPCTAQLTAGNTVDCSYSPSATETANITGAIAGQYYLLLITNYSNQPGNITFAQTGGGGSTDCSIVTPSCPTVGFHAEDASNNVFNLPISLDCTTDGWVFLRADDPATAGGSITPTVTVNVSTNGIGTGNNIYGYENNGGTWNSYWGATNIPANSNYSFTMFEMDNVTPLSFGIEMCDVNSGSDMSYTVVDNNCGGTITSGTWATADGTNGGSPGPNGSPASGGCQFITFPISAVTGIATYSCPTCPPGSFVATDYGQAFFNPAQAGPGSYNITYSFDDECGCQGDATETIVVTNPYDATFSYTQASYCQSDSDPTPTVTQTGGVFSSSPAGLSINSSTGAVDVSASTVQTYTVTYTVGGGATDYSGNCNDVQTFSLTINPDVVTTFAFGTTSTICENDPVPALPNTSTNGITGTWSPATVSNTASGTYTFTPTAGQCATTATYTVTVNPSITPTFAFGTTETICENGAVQTLPNTSTNGINGTWSPATVSNTANGTYTFTPTAGQCAVNTTFTVTVTTNVTPTFAFGTSETICENGAVQTLPNTSTNGITGTWSPASVSNTANGTYTFTPGAGQCAVNTTFTVTVTPNDTPIFAFGTSTSICSGTTAPTLPNTSNNGISGTWSPATVSNTANGTYNFTPTAGQCANPTSFTVTIDALPIVDITTPLQINCVNSSVALDGSNSEQGAGINYSWNATSGGSISGAGNTDTETALTIGDYELTVTNTNTSCVNSATVSVTDNFDTPTANVTTTNGGMLDCMTTSLILDGSASTNGAGTSTGISYTWSTTSGGASIGSNATHSVNTAGDYYLLVTEDASGCTDEISITITADASLPAAIITNLNPLTCDSTTITLIGSNSTGGTLDFDWQDAGSNTISITETVVISTPGNYSLTITDTDNNCTNTANVTVIEDVTPPSISVVTPVIVDCNNPQVSLDGSASDQGASFTYFWSTADGVIIGDTDLDTAATSETGTYNLLIENTTNGCTSTADVMVTVDTVSPIADAGVDVNFPCGVNDVALDGSSSSGASITYNWTGAGTITNGTTSTPDVTGTGNYTLTVTGSNGCTDTDVVEVIPDANAPIADAGTDIVVTCLNNLPVTLDGSGSDSGTDYTYSWSTTGTGIIIDGNTVNPTVDQEGTYEILVTNTSNNCTATATVNITTDTISPVADAGSGYVITCNSSLQQVLDGSNSTGTNITYNWTTSNGTIDSQTGFEAMVSSAGDYELTVTGDNGCTDISTVSVTMDTVSPIVNILTPNDIGCDGTGVVLDASLSSGNNITYAWSNGTNSPTTMANSAGTYILTVTNDNGCETIDSVAVNATTPPVADFTPSVTTGDIPLSVDFTNNSTGNNISSSWDFNDGNTSIEDNPSNSFNEVGSYTIVLTVTDEEGCTDTASVIVTTSGLSELIVPNIFSPNGDGENDIFNVNGTNISEITGTIFNRWGQIIYEWDVLEVGWDGYTVAGTPASEGTYYFLINAIGADGKVYDLQGAFTLLR